MYTIKQAAARAGLTVPVLRAWERRYGVVEPQRTSSGYRVYAEDDVTRLRAMRKLVEDGWGPSAAAGFIRGSTPEEITALGRSVPAAARVDSGPGGLVERFVAAAATLNPARVEGLLDEMLAQGSFESVWDRLLDPALDAMGEAWAAGEIDVAAEHAASHAVLRRLAAAFQAAGRPPAGRGAVVVGLPPEVRHELGALAFATAARRAGMSVLYLGADVPLPDWVGAVARTDAAAAVIGAVMSEDVGPAGRVAAALRESHPASLVAFGGPAAPTALEHLGPNADDHGGTIVLPQPLEDAVEALRSALHYARRRARRS
jgi:methanogenic corrinoid protein MtbC1